MVSRMHFTDREEAIGVAEAIDAAGLEVALITERDGEQDDDESGEGDSYLVASPASAAELTNFVPAGIEITED